MHPMPPLPSNRSDFLRRLAYFAIGLAIGLVMLGFFQNARRAEMARAAAERAASEAANSASSKSAPSNGTIPDATKPRNSP